jgi:hypothetical protein
MGKFVKQLNSFTWDYFGDGPWHDFYYARGGTWREFHGKKCLVMGKKIAIVEDQKKERSIVVTTIGCRNPTLRQVRGWDSHSQKWELGVLHDSHNFRAQL